MISKNPKVSILMAVHNEEKHIPEAIQSTINQTFQNWELIVINDGSTDNTKTIAENFAKKDKRIKLINQENKFKSTALNNGLKSASGNFICILDGDDVYLKDKLEKQIKFLEKNKALDMIYSDMIAFNGKEKYVKAIELKKDPKEILIDASRKNFQKDNVVVARILSEDKPGFIPCCSVMIRRKIFKRLEFDEKLKTIQDYDMWFQIIGAGYKIKRFPLISYKYRIHEGNISKDKKTGNESSRRIIKKLKSGAYFNVKPKP